jgi:uncharacterized membrane protein YhaH (DUF805 family)
MANALEGTAPPKPSLREEANATRIGRARFIGHAVGYILLFAAIAGGLQFLGGHVPALLETITLTTPSGPVTAPLLNRWIVLVLVLLLMAAIGELAIRRRHDRNHTSADVIVWMELLLASLVLHLFGPALDALRWFDLGLGVIGLYVLVVLVLLPGTRGPNRYGPAPHGD